MSNHTPWTLAGLALCALAPAQASLFSATGAAGDALGTSIAIVGDVSGDGVADVLVGAPGAAGGAGQAVLYSGADGSVIATLSGDSAGDAFGTSVAGLGDANGDGVPDYAVGAPGDDNTGADAGSARVFSGAGGVLYTVDGGAGGDAFGSAVSAAGDANGDGYADVAVGAPGADNAAMDAGRVQVFSGNGGGVLGTFDGDASGDGLGSAVAPAGDPDGDCMDDVVAGAPGDDTAGLDAGNARVLSSALSSVLWSVDGAAAGDAAGSAVAGLGDVNADGVDDFAFGSPGDDAAGMDAGAVSWVSGATGLVLGSFNGAAAGDAFGSAVAGLGDADGDGADDMAVGAPNNAAGGVGAGQVQVWSVAGGSLLMTMRGDAGAGFGGAVGGVGDLNADGYMDVAVGASADGSGAGSASVLGRAPYERLAEAGRLSPAGPNSSFGFVVRPLGDINKDGVPDYGVSAVNNAPGDVYIYSGADNSTLFTFTGPVQPTNPSYGVAIENIGDIDGDTYPEIAIGAWHYDNLGFSDTGYAEIISGQTGLVLKTHFGTSQSAHLGSGFGGLGDIDGDQVNDYYICLAQVNSLTGAVEFYSGATHTVIPGRTLNGVVTGEWFGWSSELVGDIDKDGVPDFVVGAPSGQTQPTPGNGYARVFSGATGAILHTFNGLGQRDLFGYDVAAAGDVDADGTPDIIVGAYNHDAGGGALVDAGMARVFSGATGAILYTYFGAAAGDQFGESVAGVGDVNGDGHDDFTVGAPNASPAGKPAAGLVTLYSGRDGSVLRLFPGGLLFHNNRYGEGIGDVNGDGLADIVTASVSAPSQAGNGEVRLYRSVVGSDPGGISSFGAPCADSAGRLSRTGGSGRPAVGTTFNSTARSAPPATFAFWNLGAIPTALPLVVIGAPGCTLYTSPLATFPSFTDLTGKAAFPVPIPNNSSLVGGIVLAQWAFVDAVNPLGVVFSDASSVTIGR